MLDDISAALRRYWYWTTTGSRWRLAAGIGGPLVAIFLLVNTISGGGGDKNTPGPSPTASNVAVGVLITPRTSVSAAASPGSTQAATSAAQPRATATPAASALTYVVKSGDTLGAICAAQVRNMDIPACVTAIVSLNRLTGPDQLALGQSLTLPAGGSGTAASTQPANTQAASTQTSAQTNTGSTASTATRPASTNPTQQASQSVSIVFLTTPVGRGQNATLRAVVPPNTTCFLSYTTPSGTVSDAQGLGNRSSDAQGVVSWTWQIGAGTQAGKNGSVKVTCGANSASSAIEIT